MIRKAVAGGLAGLGLIGGAGVVTYNDEGTPTVTIEDKASGTKQTVQLEGGSGPGYSCPPGVQDKVEPHDIQLGRIKLTLRPVERKLGRLDKEYPGKVAPKPVAVRYNALLRRDKRLTRAYNDEVGARNAILDAECERGPP